MVNPNLRQWTSGKQADNEANWHKYRCCLSVCEPARDRACLPLHRLLNLTRFDVSKLKSSSSYPKFHWLTAEENTSGSTFFFGLKIAIHAIPKWFNGRPSEQAVLFWDVLDAKTMNLSETARPADLFLCYFASPKNLRICMVLSWHLDIQVKIIPFKPIRKPLKKPLKIWWNREIYGEP